MKRVTAVFLALVFLIGSASATFSENMAVKDNAQASVNRPLMNHIKAFTNNYLPPLYDLIKAVEDFFRPKS